MTMVTHSRLGYKVSFSGIRSFESKHCKTEDLAWNSLLLNCVSKIDIYKSITKKECYDLDRILEFFDYLAKVII